MSGRFFHRHTSATHYGNSTTVSEGFEERVPADVLGKLPNLQYFASVSGGRLLKGRFPIIEVPCLTRDVTP